MLLPELIAQENKRRPNARMLVLEACADDALVTAEWLRRCGLNPGHGALDRVLVLDCATYGRKRRHMGVVDIVFTNNTHNMARTDKCSNYKSIVQYLNSSQRNQVTWFTIEPEPLLGLADIVRNDVWTCGEPFIVEGSEYPFRAPFSDLQPCGASNPNGVWFCRSCGRFRSLSYRR